MSAISVIIPCYNHEKYIHETIESVLSQTFDDYEIIIVNDGSTDNSLSIINSYAKKYPHKIRVIDQKNKGVVIARNNAISLAKADLIFPLDADDTIEPNCLHTLYENIKNGDFDVVYCKVKQFGLETSILELKKPTKWNMGIANQVCVSALFRKSDWQQIGGYDVNMKNGLEDWDFWLSFIENGKKFHCVEEVLMNYRILEKSRNNIHPEVLYQLNDYLSKKHPKIFFYAFVAKYLKIICQFFFQIRISKKKHMVIRICKIPIFVCKVSQKVKDSLSKSFFFR